MAKIVVKSAKFGIVVKELDTANYQDRAVLIRDLLQAIPDADWFEERSGNRLPIVKLSMPKILLINHPGL